MRWALLAAISEEDARAVLAVARRRRFAKGEVVFHEGDPGDTLHLIDTGRVAVRVTTPMGETATLRILGPGAFFGEMSVISPAPRNATIVALEPVQTLGLHRDTIGELRRHHPAVDRWLLEAVIEEVRRLSLALLDALYVPVVKRIPRRLVELVELYGGVDDAGEVVVPLTQEDLAGLCGTTRPTTNHVLMELQERGVLRLARGRVTVLDLPTLRRAGR